MCFETHYFGTGFARAQLMRGKNPEMPKAQSPQALKKKTFSWVLSTPKCFGVLNPVLMPHLLLVLCSAPSRRPCPTSGTVSAPGMSVGMMASGWFIIHRQGCVSKYLSTQRRGY